MRYRKRPLEIEAVKFVDGDRMVMEKLSRWFTDNEMTDAVYSSPNQMLEKGHIMIPTLEGSMMVQDGDYIIKGIKGEFYPCKPDVFEETYEAVE